MVFLIHTAFKSVRLEATHPIDLFAVRFRPWGLGAFSNHAMAPIVDVETPPADILGDQVNLLIERIRGETEVNSRVDMVNKHFRALLSLDTQRRKKLTLLAETVDAGTTRTGELAAALAVSERTFRRMWNHVVGVEYRKFAVLMRFHRAISRIDAGAELVTVANDCGYADHAHMAREIRRIAGLPPSVLKTRLGNEMYSALYKERPSAPWLIGQDR